MEYLPQHGRISCNRCHQGCSPTFDITRRQQGSWRITANPLSWGSKEPEVIILGFSKGPTQAGALASQPHDQIAYRGSRRNVGKILAHVGLLPAAPADQLKAEVDRLLTLQGGRFHFGSLIRCTVERMDEASGQWKGSGGGMLDRFMADPFGQEVALNCANQYLGSLPAVTRLIVMFGLGTNLNYVRAARGLIGKARETNFRTVNDVAYTDGQITVVHVEHFAAQGALIPNWLGENTHKRARLGLQARDAVSYALAR